MQAQPELNDQTVTVWKCAALGDLENLQIQVEANPALAYTADSQVTLDQDGTGDLS